VIVSVSSIALFIIYKIEKAMQISIYHHRIEREGKFTCGSALEFGCWALRCGEDRERE
jgi:hypothetical protein